MKIGINKKLYERRLELDYSEKEASIRLDISRRKLYLIENGYIDVNQRLQAKFIRKYKLEPDFFANDENLGYPTPLENPEIKPNKKVLEAISSVWTKVITAILAVGFLIMGGIGLDNLPKINERTPQMFSPEIHRVENVVKEKGKFNSYLLSGMSQARLDDFYTMSIGDYNPLLPSSNEFYYSGINFYDNPINISYTFLNSYGYFDSTVIDVPFIDEDTYTVCFETKFYSDASRTHMFIFSSDDILCLSPRAHVSADANYKTGEFKVNLVQSRDIFGSYYDINPLDYSYPYVLKVYEKLYKNYFVNIMELFDTYYPDLNMSYASFQRELSRGNAEIDKYYTRNNSFLVIGFIIGILSLAIFVLSIILSYSLDEKLIVKAEEGMNFEENKGVPFIPIKERPLKKNWKIPPFIPEAILRIAIIIVLVVSGVGLYKVFSSIAAVDIEAALKSIAFRQEIAAFSTLAVLLYFFIKLDIRSKTKNVFLSNFVLFFAGLLYYFLMVAAISMLGTETGLVTTVINDLLTTYLPGNLIWSILAFNLLVSSLFSKPEFKNPTKLKHVLYRLTALIPIGYMTASIVVQVGQKVGGWNLPYTVTALFFTKAILITVFSVVFCVAMFIYRSIVYKRYGKENAEIFQNGRKYFFIKNLIVAFILAAIVLADYLIGKSWPNNGLKLGTNYVLLFGIPLVLFYHPHMGKRSHKWDTIFTILYVIALILGVLLIIGAVASYLVSL